jgi:hypothetical protein
VDISKISMNIKRSLVLLTVIFSFSSIGNADILYLKDTTPVHGFIQSYQQGKIDIVTEQDGRESFPLSQITQIKVDTLKRCAVLHLADGKYLFAKRYRVDSKNIYYPGVKTQKLSLSFSQVSQAEFFPVSEVSKKLSVPYFKQRPDFCGEACIAMTAAYFGKKIDQKKINQACGVKDKRGAYSRELEIGIKKLGLKTKGVFWYSNKTDYDFYADRNRLLQAIAQNHPVLLGFWADYNDKTNENTWAFDHFVLLVGCDLIKGIFLIHDPARKKFSTLTFAEFRKHRETKFNTFFDIEFIGR